MHRGLRLLRARSARAALRLAEAEGLAVEVLHLLDALPPSRGDNPDCDGGVRRISARPELDLGHYAREVRRLAEKWTSVISMNKIDGTLITPEEIVGRITNLVGKYERV